nr:hypothetical protein [Tanacetum cinerariifolium]
MTYEREITPPQIPNNTTSGRPHVTTTVFAATTPENTPFAYRASTSANLNPMISPAFVEANYEVLESLLRERQRQIRNEDLRTKLEYFSEDYDEERKMEPRPEPHREATPTLRTRSPMVRRQQERVVGFEEAPNMEGNRRGRNAECIKPSEIEAREDENRRVNLPHLWRLTWEGTKAQKKFTKTHLAVHDIKQREGESTRAFVTRYTDDTLHVLGLHEEQHISGYVHGLRTRSLVEHLSTDLPSTYKGLMEKTYTWIEAREVATNGTLNDQRKNFERSKRSSWESNRGQKGRNQFSLYRGPNHGLLSNLSKSPREIVATEKATKSFEQPPQEREGVRHLVGRMEKEGKDAISIETPILMIRKRSYNPRKRPVEGNNSEVREITFPPPRNISFADPVIIKAYMLGRQVNRVYLDGGSSCEVTRPPKGVRRRLRIEYRTHDGSFKNSIDRRESFQHRAQSKRAQTLGTSKAKEEKPGARKKQSNSHPSGRACKGQHFVRSQVSDAGATYLRQIDKVFSNQLGRNMEVNADDIVIKSNVEEEMLADIKETLDGLRAINLKLNPRRSILRTPHHQAKNKGKSFESKGNLRLTTL